MPFRIWIVCGLIAVFAGETRAEDRVHAHYDGYAMGVRLFTIDLAESLTPASYQMELGFELTGALGALFHAAGKTQVDGRFDGPHAVPREVFGTGRFGGRIHAIQIDWQDGIPHITQMTPAAEPGREIVPLAEQAGTIDTLSAIATLQHQVAATGTCEATIRTFDGARLTEFSARTHGHERLEPTGRSGFGGETLRCDVTARMIGGFMRDGDQTALRRPREATAWLAQVMPGQAFIPVRIAVYAPAGPTATLYLQVK